VKAEEVEGMLSSGWWDDAFLHFLVCFSCALFGGIIDQSSNRVQISEQEGGRGILHERGPDERTCNNPSTAYPILSPPAAALSPAPSNVSFHPSLLVSDTGPSCVFRSMRASWG
jgi:hypothetical protein